MSSMMKHLSLREANLNTRSVGEGTFVQCILSEYVDLNVQSTAQGHFVTDFVVMLCCVCVYVHVNNTGKTR